MRTIDLSGVDGGLAQVSDYGAHLLKWTTGTQRDWIFLSQQAQFEAGKAIRGGVPVIFPQFNERGPSQRHGFARNVTWQVIQSDSQQAVFELVSDAQSRSLWPFDFKAQFVVTLSNGQISLSLNIENTDNQPFQFTAALHTYFAVKDFPSVTVSGLNGVSYWDNDGSAFDQRAQFKADVLTFEDAIDRVFFDVNEPLQLHDHGDCLEIDMSGFKDVVVWNPGKAGAAGMGDMADDEYLRMLCIEAAAIDHPVHLAPGEKWQGVQVLTAK